MHLFLNKPLLIYIILVISFPNGSSQFHINSTWSIPIPTVIFQFQFQMILIPFGTDPSSVGFVGFFPGILCTGFQTYFLQFFQLFVLCLSCSVFISRNSMIHFTILVHVIFLVFSRFWFAERLVLLAYKFPFFHVYIILHYLGHCSDTQGVSP